VESELKVYKNGLYVEGLTNGFVVIDRDEHAHHHFLGVNARQNALMDYFNGYIYTFRVSNVAVKNFDDLV
jgi:hypothetical protein